jgi:Kef-type K+ transport system membrane component KefB
MFLPHSVPLVVSLLLLLLLARLLGEIFERFNKPAMIGEVLAGIILGPSLLNVVAYNEQIKVLSDLGVLLLVVLAGLEIGFDELREALRRKYSWISILGFTIPFAVGTLIGHLFGFAFEFSIFLGLCMSITALPVSIRILMDLGKLRSPVGRQIISAAVFNDVLALLVLGIILDMESWSGSNSCNLWKAVGFSLLKIVALVVVIILLYRLLVFLKARIKAIGGTPDKILNYFKGKESLFAFVIVFVLIFASLTELLGLHFIVGAFLGAMLLGHDALGARNYIKVKNNTSGITMGFLAPVFFAAIGLEFEVNSINNILLLVVVVLASFVTKVAGGYLGGLMAGFKQKDAVALGIGLNARGIMELVIANIALSNHFIDKPVFSILVLMGILTTLITPILLKKAFALGSSPPVRNLK